MAQLGAAGPRSMIGLVPALLGLLSLGLVGCATAVAGAVSAPPRLALDRYVQASSAEDAEALHRLLGEPLDTELTVDDVRRLLSENAEELETQARTIAEAADDLEAIATQPLASGESVRLVFEDGRWVIDGGVIAAPGLRTPMAAVRAFRRALQRRSLEGALRVLAREPRAELEAELSRIVEETGDELDLEVEIRGNRARVRTSSGRHIDLVREAGEWRIVKIE